MNFCKILATIYEVEIFIYETILKVSQYFALAILLDSLAQFDYNLTQKSENSIQSGMLRLCMCDTCFSFR